MADMSTRLMLDDVDLTVEAPHVAADVYAIGGYVNGRYANWPAIVAKWGRSGKFLLSIDVQGYPPDGAQCLDVEKGDATIGQAPAWFKVTQAAGRAARDLRWYPKLYISAGSAASLIAMMTASGIARDEYMLWSAHYTETAHICGPSTCGYPQADATQYTSKYQGASLDASLAFGYFFAGPGEPVPVPVVKSSVTWAMWPANIVLAQGSKGDAVKVLQAALRDSGIEGVRGIGVDGVFGPQTLTALRNFQARAMLSEDGIAGRETRNALVALKDVAAAKVAPAPITPKTEAPVEAPVSPAEGPVVKAVESPTVSVPVVPEAPEAPSSPVSVPTPSAPSEPPVEPVPEPVPETPPEPDVTVYVQETVTSDTSAKYSLPAGTILFIPHTVLGSLRRWPIQ